LFNLSNDFPEIFKLPPNEIPERKNNDFVYTKEPKDNEIILGNEINFRKFAL